MNKDIETSLNVPLSFVNLPEKKVATNELPQYLTTTFVGQGWFLLRNRLSLRQSKIEIDLGNDLYEEQVKENSLLQIINRQSPPNIKAIACQPQEISFQFEESIDKKIPLIVPKLLTFMQNYSNKKNIEISPDSIVVSGPGSIIDSLKSWHTDTIKHRNLNKTVTGKIGLRETLLNIVFNKYLINYEIDVAQFTEKKLSVEIKVINKQNVDLLIIPKKVDLKCLVPINEYDKITAKDFSIIADFKNEKIKHYINLKLNKKSIFAKNISFFPKSVEYITLEE